MCSNYVTRILYRASFIFNTLYQCYQTLTIQQKPGMNRVYVKISDILWSDERNTKLRSSFHSQNLVNKDKHTRRSKFNLLILDVKDILYCKSILSLSFLIYHHVCFNNNLTQCQRARDIKEFHFCFPWRSFDFIHGQMLAVTYIFRW